MKFDPKAVRKATEEDFEATWIDGRSILRKMDPLTRVSSLSVQFGRPHPVFETIQRLREAYMRIGFEEVMNPLMIEDEDVYKQFGKEALAVLDRCFYLAGLPRPNLGISDEKISRLNESLGEELTHDEVEEIQKILHRFKKGEIDGDDLVAEIANGVNISDSKAIAIFDIFPEFREVQPAATRKTLRSHMTSGWFITLEALCKKRPLPLKFFSVDRCFRREQREDEERLMNYHSASCVFMDEDVDVNDGESISSVLLSQLGFDEVRFKLDEKRSKYYVPGTQTEVFIRHKSDWMEIATFGIYSPTALAWYDIPYPVMNLGLGVERLAIMLYGASDVRRLSYPQFYDIELSDEEITKMISISKNPQTNEGYEILGSIIEVCEKRGEERSPCEFETWRGKLFGKDIVVYVFEPEEKTKLCGPAYANEIIVHGGDILGLPRDKKWENIFEEGVSTKIRYIDAFSSYAAHEIEKSVINGESCEVKAKIVRSPSDVNVVLHPIAHRYITDHKHKIDVRGPLFTTIRMEIQ
jgi:O-phosphoseryl-tRNA synthetase